MELNAAKALAESLMTEHLGEDHNWSFAFNRRSSAFGLCSYTYRTIFLSGPLTEVNDEANVRDTLLHEIAHAKVGHGHGHGPVWKAMAYALGHDGMRTGKGNMVPHKFKATCPGCGGEQGTDRRSRRVTACGWCCEVFNGGKFDERFVLVFERVAVSA